MMEDRIYSRAELRRMDLDTSEYQFLSESGDFQAVLVLKAEARDRMLRMFFDFSDGRKIITPLFWWQRKQGLWDIPVGRPLLLHFGDSTRGGVYLNGAEVLG